MTILKALAALVAGSLALVLLSWIIVVCFLIDALDAPPARRRDEP